MGLDPRLGAQCPQSRPRFGGFCFPKDIQAFIHLSAAVGVEFDMLKAAERVNKQRIATASSKKCTRPLWVVRGGSA